MAHNYERGLKAENFFLSQMNKVGLPVTFVDDWYDFIVNKKFKVEVKSCCISVKCITKVKGKKYLNYRPGRFVFTSEDNREKQFDENIWVCFMVRHLDQFILLGFIKARELKKVRCVALHQVRKFKLLDLGQWLEKVNK